jgi:hypothetical protein
MVWPTNAGTVGPLTRPRDNGLSRAHTDSDLQLFVACNGTIDDLG